MRIRPAMPELGSFALVTYLPDPLGSFLTELRQMLPGVRHPEPHITFLPPRSLVISAEEASIEIQKILRDVRPFELELGNVRMFPGTNIVYLSIENGTQEIFNLHCELNRGNLFAEEDFEFIPHLTLGGPLDPLHAACTLQQAEYRWKNSGLGRRFVVKEMVFLWQPGREAEKEWNRALCYPLPCVPAINGSAIVNQT